MKIQYKQEDRREHGCDGCHQSGFYSTEKFEGYCGIKEVLKETSHD